jgi:hypothetical protein
MVKANNFIRSIFQTNRKILGVCQGEELIIDIIMTENKRGIDGII